MRSIPVNGEPTPAAVLALRSLAVTFPTAYGDIAAVRGVSLEVAAGECLGVVGESGAGKTQAFLAPLRLLPATARVAGEARLLGQNLLVLPERDLDMIRGRRVGMVFQDPLTSLTPHLTVGRQIAEVIEHHGLAGGAAASERALALLRQVRVSDPERRLRQYPHELSGGMRQRVMLAIALACDPALVIADEPTTALDVTVQAEILALLAALRRERRLALVLITHDLGVIAGLADRVVVMYAGQVVEEGPVAALLSAPRHPYTAALLAAMPRLDMPRHAPLAGIGGVPPDPRHLPEGCAFHPRCARGDATCRAQVPTLHHGASSRAACHHPLDGERVRP
jgi:oligopeptide/dipeptide ABC transporter ATP-binding protein